MNTALPGNPRYQPQKLEPVFGYDRLYQTVAEVELATLEVLGEIGVIPDDEMALLTPEKRDLILAIPTTEVDRIEREITKHDIRAWVRRAQEILDPKLGRWLHVPLTSYDPISTGRVLQFVRAHNDVIKPSVKEVVSIFIDMVRRFADVAQIGRTHGQHALPVTVGFWLATILDRILRNAQEMDRYASLLEGKISGAVGAHNAQYGLQFTDCCCDKSFEERVLAKLGLKPAMISTQILPPEGLAYYLFSCVMMSAAFAQFGRDGRHLMRSEIGEIAEAFESGQVGSSTMAHKRNPINFENLEGMFTRNLAEFFKVQQTLISEHQRDLVGSSVSRDFPIIVVNLQQQLDTLLRCDKSGTPWLARITVDGEALERNLAMSANVILAEPLYIALQMAGYEGDAHELVNWKLVPKVRSSGRSFIEVLAECAGSDDGVITQALDRIPRDVIELLRHPERYTGDAKEQALAVASRAEQYLGV
ncbi:MAG: lyase family protein [Patescibacteria group bacterium]|nr:lyase family protein [Patescibacteria group bacterium]